MAEKNAKKRRAEKRSKLQRLYNVQEKQAKDIPVNADENTDKEKNVADAVRERRKEEKVFCPKCGAELESRKSICQNCGYKGYVPLSNAQSKKIRRILFVVFGAVAVAILIWRIL